MNLHGFRQRLIIGLILGGNDDLMAAILGLDDLRGDFSAVGGCLGNFIHRLAFFPGLLQSVCEGRYSVLDGFCGHRFRIGLGRPALPLAGFRPDSRKGARLEVNLEGDASAHWYIEFEFLVLQLLDGVRDFNVLDPLDLLTFLDEANRYRVPEFCCKLSAFHVPYLRVYDVCLTAE